MFVVLWQLHLDTEVLTFFECFLVSEAPLRCRVVVVAKLSNCRVPSSSNLLLKDRLYNILSG